MSELEFFDEDNNYGVNDNGNESNILNSQKKKTNLVQLTLEESLDNKKSKERLKLDSNVLLGNKGLSVLPDMFKIAKFRGKNHEGEDLKVLLSIYELWALRLFPKYNFNDVISKIERLGHKRDVQTYIQKMHDKYVDEQLEANKRLNLDELYIATTRDTCPTNNLISNPTFDYEDNSSITFSQISPPEATQEVNITDDIKARIESNRLLALERQKRAKTPVSISKESETFEQPSIGNIDVIVNEYGKQTITESNIMEIPEAEQNITISPAGSPFLDNKPSFQERLPNNDYSENLSDE